MKKNYFKKRYFMVSDFSTVDRTSPLDTPEEKERKDLRRKARYITIIDGEVSAGGKCYGLDGTGCVGYLERLSSSAPIRTYIFQLRNVNAEIGDNFLGFNEDHPFSKINYDPCEKYREEYIKKYGGTLEDLEG